jgi:hypothetical protein
VTKELGIIQRALSFEPLAGAAEINSMLRRDGYSAAVGNQIETWLDGYKKHYLKIFNDREAVIDKLMAFHEKTGWSVNEYKDRYFNESLHDLVRNVRAGDPIIEYRGELVQQLDPVFQAPTPSGIADYRTGFFLPEKNLLGVIVPTYLFNVIAIWAMCLVLYVTLAGKVSQLLKY